MEVAVARRELVLEKKATETTPFDKKHSRSSSSDSDEMYSDTFPKGAKAIHKSEDIVISSVKNGGDQIVSYQMNKTLILDGKNAASSSSFFTKAAMEEAKEVDLNSLYTLPDSHNFFCPNCKSCVTKVLILPQDDVAFKIPRPSYDVSPIAGVIGLPVNPRYDSAKTEVVGLPVTQKPSEPPTYQPAVGQSVVQSLEPGGEKILCSNCFSFLGPIGDWISSQLGFGKTPLPVEPTQRDPGSSGFRREPDVGSVIIPVISDEEPTLEPTAIGGRKMEVIKSIVYGGLTESITSLGIVTSAASANTATEKIVALAVANLVTGLIVIFNNLSSLKSNELKKEVNTETETEQKDEYEEALGDRQHYLLHFMLAVMSFIVFGLLPPLVYGFSFQQNDDNDLKLVAVAATSLICIALLAIGKAYIQKPEKWLEYAKTVSYYVTIGVGASGLSYVAGKEIGELIEHFGWFKGNTAPTVLLPGFDFAKPAWESF